MLNGRWISYLVSNLCLNAGFSPKKAPIQSCKVSQFSWLLLILGFVLFLKNLEILPEQVRLVPWRLKIVCLMW
jgi:hypothetical protein